MRLLHRYVFKGSLDSSDFTWPNIAKKSCTSVARCPIPLASAWIPRKVVLLCMDRIMAKWGDMSSLSIRASANELPNSPPSAAAQPVTTYSINLSHTRYTTPPHCQNVIASLPAALQVFLQPHESPIAVQEIGRSISLNSPLSIRTPTKVRVFTLGWRPLRELQIHGAPLRCW